MIDRSAEISPTFCVLPWQHLYASTSGDIYPCCWSDLAGNQLNAPGETIAKIGDQAFLQAWNSEKLIRIRRQLLSGEWPQECQRCQKQEEFQLQSQRKAMNAERIFDPKQIRDSTAADGRTEAEPRFLDIRIGNVCNLRCRMCSPEASQKLLSFFGGQSYWKKNPSKDFSWSADPKILDELLKWAKSLDTINFAGGEPMLAPPIKRLLAGIVAAGEAHHIKLTFNTNGTIINEEILTLLPEFASVSFCVSLDGPAKVNSYIRSPAKWSDVEAFLRRIHDRPVNSNFEVVISPTVQALNIGFLPELVDEIWTKYPNFPGYFGTSLVSGPEHFSAQVLPRSLKDWAANNFRLLREKWEKHPQSKYRYRPFLRRFSGLVDFMFAEDKSELWPQLVAEMHRYDEIYAAEMPQSMRELLAGDVPEVVSLARSVPDILSPPIHPTSCDVIKKALSEESAY